MPPYFTPRLATPHQSGHTSTTTPSPNYFGFQTNGEPNNDDGQQTKAHWSPPTSTVQSTAAVSPSAIPHEHNPEFSAFKKHSEGKAFNLGGLSAFAMNAPPTRNSGGKSSKTVLAQDSAKSVPAPRTMPPPPRVGRELLEPNVSEMSQSPKRMLSPDSRMFPDIARRGSPASMADGEHGEKHRREHSPERQPRKALPLDTNTSGSYAMPIHRAETLPESGKGESQVMVTAQRVINLLESSDEEVLILDLRVSTHFAQAHVAGALTLCIPTTLLKRPAFNVEKLAATFKDESQRAKFENWRSSKYIVVYDNSSAQLKDAMTCMNTIKKFRTEGYAGTLYIIKGGFQEFAKRFPGYVEAGVDATNDDLGASSTDPEGRLIPPVIGGCPMPLSDKPANPFFGNIRQNMDLIGGVGQMSLKHPTRATRATEENFPAWMKQVSDDQDQGKRVSDRFEQIERREKKRMEDALSGKVTFATSPHASKHAKPVKNIQIAGIEKGNKNRYNNIWPFEHSRVRLQGVPSHGCDYFNASYIKAAWSNKRYISTQAPIPATFNDFWNVVWQQDIRVIVMLTAEQEGAQVKAHNYWNGKQYGQIHLDFLSEKRASIEPAKIHRAKMRPSVARRSSTNPVNIPLAPVEAKDDRSKPEQPYVIVRKFTLSHENFPFERMREVTQLQYSSWPDFGAPAHPAHLLGLVEQCDSVVRTVNKTHSNEPEPANNRPTLVHCSAGCGRTGTFCTVDSVIDMLKRQRLYDEPSKNPSQTAMDVDSKSSSKPFSSRHNSDENNISGGSWIDKDDIDLVEKTVEDFRNQRISMVQSLRQYVLCYESVMEWLVSQEQGPGDVGES
ncbi:hypothetical protein B0A48_03976 [Cryoendolithus antarcticus]|uniref:protein-tyrosine-phosphatase n=1 Tax=Cryoendolithus antarcticus TaxID=1507870 RepID=A0A1V8TH10_9PEZI|nr:hypothetical protein B0A48_03976 [Cryoendolithus antarcticus]